MGKMDMFEIKNTNKNHITIKNIFTIQQFSSHGYTEMLPITYKPSQPFHIYNFES